MSVALLIPQAPVVNLFAGAVCAAYASQLEPGIRRMGQELLQRMKAWRHETCKALDHTPRDVMHAKSAPLGDCNSVHLCNDDGEHTAVVVVDGAGQMLAKKVFSEVPSEVARWPQLGTLIALKGVANRLFDVVWGSPNSSPSPDPYFYHRMEYVNGTLLKGPL